MPDLNQGTPAGIIFSNTLILSVCGKYFKTDFPVKSDHFVIISHKNIITIPVFLKDGLSSQMFQPGFSYYIIFHREQLFAQHQTAVFIYGIKKRPLLTWRCFHQQQAYTVYHSALWPWINNSLHWFQRKTADVRRQDKPPELLFPQQDVRSFGIPTLSLRSFQTPELFQRF